MCLWRRIWWIWFIMSCLLFKDSQIFCFVLFCFNCLLIYIMCCIAFKFSTLARTLWCHTATYDPCSSRRHHTGDRQHSRGGKLQSLSILKPEMEVTNYSTFSLILHLLKRCLLCCFLCMPSCICISVPWTSGKQPHKTSSKRQSRPTF